MKELIKVIAFDADDTLWSNEPFFQEIEKQYTDLLKPYGTSEDISAALFQTEMNNLKYLGYGAKAFTISMVETALHVSGQKISGTDIQHIIELGKSLLKMPIELLPGVKETLKELKEKGKYKLVVATKGDLLDQENKLERSGLASYFDHIEVMSDKTEKEYQRMLNILQIAPSEFVMIGNSLKSDIQPVLSLGGYGIHIPFEVMWKHEVVDTFLQEFFRISGTHHSGRLSDRITLKLTVFNTFHHSIIVLHNQECTQLFPSIESALCGHICIVCQKVNRCVLIFCQQFGSHFFNAFLCIVESSFHFFLRFPYITDHQIITRIDHIRYPVENPESRIPGKSNIIGPIYTGITYRHFSSTTINRSKYSHVRIIHAKPKYTA